MRLLFVCTGNTCRSPMAEYITRALAQEAGLSLEVRSAGVAALAGPISAHAQEVLQERGYWTPEAEHTARSVTEEWMEWADLILTMTLAHKQILASQYPEVQEKLFTLKEYTRHGEEGNGGDIRDPFGGDLDRYRETADELEEELRRLVRKLKGGASDREEAAPPKN